jgi:hypothetical protein
VEYLWNYILTEENRSIRRKVYPSATLPTTNTTWICQGSNTALSGENSALDSKRYSTAFIEEEKGGRILQTNAPRFPKGNCSVKSQTAPVSCRSSESNIQVKTSMEYWWNDTDKEGPKY